MKNPLVPHSKFAWLVSALTLTAGLWVIDSTAAGPRAKRQAVPPKEVSPCITALMQSGQLVRAADLRERLRTMEQYLSEMERHHDGRPSEPTVLSTPAAVSSLQAQFGPIVTVTTFSRELNPAEFLRTSSQILGFLSGLPEGRAIIASGGTMGDRSNLETHGGGVGILHPAAMQMGFKTLSITAAAAFQYRAAPADFLLFSMQNFGSESRMMLESSKALLVMGGGAQAFNEATEYLIYNPDGILVLIDDSELSGSSSSLAHDQRFKEFATNHPNIIVAKTGSEAGVLLAEKLGLTVTASHIKNTTKLGLNVLSPNADFHQLLPNSHIVGFSGWTDIRMAGENIVAQSKQVIANTEKAIRRIHKAIAGSDKNIFYVTSGNDPNLAGAAAPAFETMVHDLPTTSNTHLLALTSQHVKLEELNPNVKNISFIADTWGTRTQQLVSRLDGFVTAGGNRAVIDQTINAAILQKHQIHITGANTLTDIRIEKVKNPNLKVLSPEQILTLSDAEILSFLGM